MANDGKKMVIGKADVYLPNDIFANILSYLPVKSLLRFKCISKRFKVLITNPDFVEQHLLKQQGKDAQILLASQRFMNQIAVDVMVINGEYLFTARQLVSHNCPSVHDLPEDFYFMSHSCDGILCFHGYIYIHVYNPSTRELRTLPITRSLCYHMHAHNYNFSAGSARMERECCCANKLVGLGRDLVTKEYKILRLFNPGSQHFEECEIFTLNSNPKASWKSIGIVPYKIATLQRPVYVRGAIYLLTDETYHKSEVIVMLDLHMEKFQAISLPKCCSDPSGLRRSMVLASLRGSLCVVEQTYSQLNIWIVEGFYSSTVIWKNLYSTNLLVMELELKKSMSFSIAVYKNGTILICGSKGKLYLYDQKCESFSYVSYGINGGSQVMPTTSIESLVPLYGTSCNISFINFSNNKLLIVQA